VRRWGGGGEGSFNGGPGAHTLRRRPGMSFSCRNAHRVWYGRLAVFKACLLVSMTALGVLVLPAARVAADQNPPGCTQNNLALDIGRDKTIVRNGDTIL